MQNVTLKPNENVEMNSVSKGVVSAEKFNESYEIYQKIISYQ